MMRQDPARTFWAWGNPEPSALLHHIVSRCHWSGHDGCWSEFLLQRRRDFAAVENLNVGLEKLDCPLKRWNLNSIPAGVLSIRRKSENPSHELYSGGVLACCYQFLKRPAPLRLAFLTKHPGKSPFV